MPMLGTKVKLCAKYFISLNETTDIKYFVIVKFETPDATNYLHLVVNTALVYRNKLL